MAMYLQHLITPLGILVTRLARGLPFGAELEYADDLTLGQALENRRQF
jgi:recombination protein RecR